MSARLSNTDKLHLRLRRYPSHERLVLLRNLGYGGAAVCLAVLVGLTQVGAKDFALRLAVVCASIALPAWLLLGPIFEYYIFLGKESYPHLRTNSVNRFINFWMVVGGAGTFGAAAGTIWFLMPEAAYAFFALSFCGAVAALLFQWHLARWWHGPTGPGHREGEDV